MCLNSALDACSLSLLNKFYLHMVLLHLHGLNILNILSHFYGVLQFANCYVEILMFDMCIGLYTLCILCVKSFFDLLKGLTCEKRPNYDNNPIKSDRANSFPSGYCAIASLTVFLYSLLLYSIFFYYPKN